MYIGGPEDRPVLISRTDIDRNYGYSLPLPVRAWDELAQEARGKSVRHGAYAAAELLLSEAAVQIDFVNLDEPGRSLYPEEPDTPYKHPACLLGYNDHAGGSESDNRVVVNLFGDDSSAGSYVLYSPPQKNGVLPTSTTFYRADPTFLIRSPSGRWGPYLSGVPNALKTDGVAMEQGRDYQYYVLGKTDHRTLVVDVLRAAGFSFLPRPMSEGELDDIGKHARSDTLELNAAYRDPTWPYGEFGADPPKGQFAEQIARLRIAEASL
ncbi:hypothetical protein CSA80_00675 [Candidatus Saccharibacteria bacterium]|nr:MAG: hypothetical protein CSA80_00675 [Candidatus Saccharibacteria bacterium]